ncbi:MAG: DUF3881 family protein [Eubacterium sp.]|nr:DUF3881 family protein [Eubacterium sp.]
MHDFLKAVGFSKYKNSKEIRGLMEAVERDPSSKKIARMGDDKIFAEYRKDFGPSFGIALRGEVDEKGKFRPDYYYPYLNSIGITTIEYFEIEKQAEKDSYVGICDEVRVGVSLIFYLQNVSEYIKACARGKGDGSTSAIILSGLSNEANILLPLEKSDDERATIRRTVNKRHALITKAREGDEEAIENLALDEIDTYSKISHRVLQEDIFTIVDTSFMPYGIESDQYYAVGEILRVEETQNELTGETVYQMKLDCNDLILPVCINKENLCGEPAVGRRFKGRVWVQGKILFA